LGNIGGGELVPFEETFGRERVVLLGPAVDW
jgi:hypothetical protein